MALIGVYGIRFTSCSGYELGVRAGILIMCKTDYPWKLTTNRTTIIALGMPKQLAEEGGNSDITSL